MVPRKLRTAQATRFQSLGAVRLRGSLRHRLTVEGELLHAVVSTKVLVFGRHKTWVCSQGRAGRHERCTDAAGR